ncbi:MAG: flagellar assembly protein A [Campylobacterota bacterium]|nr:flagellar assembly protein A [Campylobacterota bacterium]
MALFGSDKKAPPLSKKIRPTVVRTKNIAKELIKLAKSNDIRPDTLDFNILEVQTLTRLNVKGESEGEWEERDPESLSELDENTELLNPDFQIEQMYEVEIFSKDKDDKYKDLKMAVGAKASKCEIYLSIKAGSKIEYNSSFDKEFLLMINKAKAKAGILINIFDQMLHDTVSKITAHVRVEEKVEYSKNEIILICESLKPTPTIDDKLILHYDQREEISELQRINYAKRGFIQGVTEGELLMEYIKPKKGNPGRNCSGDYLEPREPEVVNVPKFSVDSAIKIIDNNDNIQYISKENGYIALENNQYLIKTDVDISEVTFKSTGHIESGIDSEVNIVVKETDAVKDAIGTGMIVEVSSIHIEGNVGSTSKVTALKASVGGQTHKTAQITADDLDINIHKGKAYGKNIRITRLEHGEVYGENIDIKQAIGGIIQGEEVSVDVCASYVKINASKTIEIHKLQGEENVFTINPLAKNDIQDGLLENENKIREIKIKLKEISKEVEKYKSLVKGNKQAFKDITKRLVHYKKNGVKMPSSFVKKYKHFKNVEEHLENIKEEEKVKHYELELFDKKTAFFQDGIFEARIINRDRWDGHNELRFKLVDPPLELSFIPPAGSKDMIFGLAKNEDEDIIIQAMEE